MSEHFSQFKCKPVYVKFMDLRVGDEYIDEYDGGVSIEQVKERTETHLVAFDSQGESWFYDFATLSERLMTRGVLVIYREHQDVTLYRPVGDRELQLIKELGKFPPRLPDQLIFYPVTNERYAWEIAEGWNRKDGIHVVKFTVRGDVLAKYPVQTVGRSYHTEHWIPAEELEAFNAAILGPIEEIFKRLPDLYEEQVSQMLEAGVPE